MSTDFDQLTIKLNADSNLVTKDDEVETIINLNEFFDDKQLYLTDLFTGRMTAWMVNTIRADVCPDLYAEWMHSKDDADHYKDVTADRDAQIKELKDHIHRLTLEIGELKLTIGERDTSIKTDAKTMADLQDIVTDLSEGILSYQEDAEEHANEINKLKAQLWDLTKEQLIREWGTGGV